VRSTSSPATRPRPRLRHVVAGALLVLACLPVSVWLPGQPPLPGYPALLRQWLSATVVLLVLATCAAGIEQRFAPALQPVGDRLRALAGHAAAPWIAALLACGLSGIVAYWVFDRHPLHVDAITQAYQATVFASGHTSVPTPAHPEFTASFLVADIAGRTFAQFPPGWAALLALGQLVGAGWLVGPLLLGAAVLALYALARGLDASPAQSLGTAAAFGCSPWVVILAASWMNHLPALAFLLAGAAALVHAERGRRWGLALLAGLCLGASLTIRPIDAMVYIVPGLGWLVLSAWRTGRWTVPLAVGAGLLPPLLALLWYNGQTTGHALRLGYEALWGPAHRLGFHTDPWGTPHTLTRGLGYLNAYLLDLQGELFGSLVPGILLCLLAVTLIRRVAVPERWLLIGSTLLMLTYVAYWHRGDFFGPRFLFSLAPIAILWTVRLPDVISARWNRPGWTAVARWSVILTIASGALLGWPIRWSAYREYAPARRWDADGGAAAAGVVNGLVFIREPWGAQLLARLWGRGVPHSEAQQLYQQVDSCILYLAVQDLERFNVAGDSAVSALHPLRADSSQVRTMTGAADSTLRMRPGTAYPEICRRRLREDRLGTQPFAPLLLAGAHGNRFVRDLQERNAKVITEMAGRPVYQLRFSRDAAGAIVRSFVLVRPDSAVASWRLDAAEGGLAALRAAAMAVTPPSR